MKFINFTFDTPEENLACDEALLEAFENTDDEILRIWHPATYFAVLGYSRKLNHDLYRAECQKRAIPILRRVSGGGTVLQGTGCLNYTLVLQIDRHRDCSSIIKTNRYVMEIHKNALAELVGKKVEISGDSDLTIDGNKFSGNAQRRKKTHFLFHGTFLLDFDFDLIRATMPIPERKPIYRNGRSHEEFLMNLEIPAQKIIEGLQEQWNAFETFEQLPQTEISRLAETKYSQPTWNFKF